jgi:hypothetical protein
VHRRLGGSAATGQSSPASFDGRCRSHKINCLLDTRPRPTSQRPCPATGISAHVRPGRKSHSQSNGCQGCKGAMEVHVTRWARVIGPRDPAPVYPQAGGWDAQGSEAYPPHTHTHQAQPKGYCPTARLNTFMNAQASRDETDTRMSLQIPECHATLPNNCD